MPALAFSLTVPFHRPTATALAPPTPSRLRRPHSPCSTVASLYSPPRPRLPYTLSPPIPPRGGPPTPPSDPPWWHRPPPPARPAPSFLALLSHLLRRYNASLAANPLPTKAASSALLVLLSDLVAQTLTASRPDLPRLLRHLVYGLLVAGPQGHFWFRFLDRLVRFPGAPAVLTKVALDQLAFSPLATAGFFAIMKVGEGGSLTSAAKFVRENILPTMRNSWKIWPFVNVVNFSVVPPQHRVVFTSAVSVFWIAFLSLVANPAHAQKQPNRAVSVAGAS